MPKYKRSKSKKENQPDEDSKNKSPNKYPKNLFNEDSIKEKPVKYPNYKPNKDSKKEKPINYPKNQSDQVSNKKKPIKYLKSNCRVNYLIYKNNKKKKYKKRKWRQYINGTPNGNTLEINIKKKKIYSENNKKQTNNEIFLQNETNKVGQYIFTNNNELEKMKLNILENNIDIIKENTNKNTYSNILNEEWGNILINMIDYNYNYDLLESNSSIESYKDDISNIRENHTNKPVKESNLSISDKSIINLNKQNVLLNETSNRKNIENNINTHSDNKHEVEDNNKSNENSNKNIINMISHEQKGYIQKKNILNFENNDKFILFINRKFVATARFNRYKKLNGIK